MKIKLFLATFFLSLFTFYFDAKAQKTLIQGQVLEKDSKEPVPFANIRMKNAKNGMTSDEFGGFSFYTSSLPDTMIVSEIGYDNLYFPIKSESSGKIKVFLKPSGMILDEAVIIAYRDPGKALMRKVVSNKSQNDLNRSTDFVRGNYTKTEIDAFNLTVTNKKSLLNEVLQTYNKYNPDTSTHDAIPLFFSESYWQEFHGKSMQTLTKKKLAEKNMGLPTDQLGQKLDRFDINLDIYDGVITLLKTSFVSPVSALGLTFYHFEILDTLDTSPHREFIVQFAPKFKNENTFSGEFRIEEDSYAIKSLKMTTTEGMNLNFVDKIGFTQSFIPFIKDDGKEVWIVNQETQTIDFQSGLELFGIPIKADSSSKKMRIIKTINYHNYKLDLKQINGENFTSLFPKFKNTQGLFDNSMRTDSLSGREKGIYKATEALQSNNRYLRSAKLATFMASGYFDVDNKVRFGPYSSIISANRIEGIRNRVSFWTLEDVSKTWNFNGTLAYGWKDQKFKGAVGIKYVPSKEPFAKTELILNRDYDISSNVNDEVDKDNVFTLAMRKNVSNYQIFNEQLKVLHERDLSHNWSSKLWFNYSTLTPSFNFNYFVPEEMNNPEPLAHQKLHVSEVGINIRYAHNERTRIYNYDKLRIYSQFPVVNINFVSGFELSAQTYFNYSKVGVGVSQTVNLVPKGTFYYNVKAGKVFGTVPYLLMDAAQGNPLYVYNKYAFQNMSPYEFAADRYASAQFRYSMGGLILDKIPLINKFNWRERFIANFYWGDMTTKNKEYNKLIGSPAITTGRTPYAEIGAGIENIFNFFSVDAVWRLNHLNNANNVNMLGFGIYTGVKIIF